MLLMEVPVPVHLSEKRRTRSEATGRLRNCESKMNICVELTMTLGGDLGTVPRYGIAVVDLTMLAGVEHDLLVVRLGQMWTVGHI